MFASNSVSVWPTRSILWFIRHSYLLPASKQICKLSLIPEKISLPHSKVKGANTRLVWVLSAPDGLHFGPMNLAIGVAGIIILHSSVWTIPTSHRYGPVIASRPLNFSNYMGHISCVSQCKYPRQTTHSTPSSMVKLGESNTSTEFKKGYITVQ